MANLAIALLRASDWFNDALLARLAARGWPPITRTQSRLFADLDPGGTRPAELARRVGVTRQSVQKAVEGLLAERLVRIEDDPSDGRAVRVVLARRGRRLAEAANRELAALEAELAERIGEPDVEGLRRVLGLDWGPPPGS